MILRTYKPTTPSKRHHVSIITEYSVKKPVLKSKLKIKHRICGRNHSGKTTIFHRGKSHKRRYRMLEFWPETLDGVIYSIEYDPNRNSNIGSVYNESTGSFFYMLLAKNLKIGDLVKSGLEAQERTGHSMQLKNVPIGCPIYNIASSKKGCGWISRAAGNYSILINKTNTKAKILLGSGKYKNVSINSHCTIGIVSNEFSFLKQLGKAGRSRWLGKKPVVKGIAMNPVDHPNGGGEGKKSSKRKTPWGKIIKSKK